MAIDRPGTIGDASGNGQKQSGGRRREDFVASRGMGGPGSPRDLSRGVVPQGKKVDSDGVAAQTIEAQPVFGQIKPKRGQALACLEQYPREKTWRISIAKNKGAQRTSVEKEPVAQKRDASPRERSAGHR